MIKVNITDFYEGHDKFVYLELEKSGKTLFLRYDGYTNIKFNKVDNEITLDLDVFKDLLDSIIEEVENGENYIKY